MLPKVSGIENFQAREGEISRVLSNFFISQDRKTPPWNLSLLQKFFGRRTYFMGKKTGVSRVSEKKILSDCTKLFRWRTVWCFRKIPLSENFLNRRGGAHHRFIEFFCLTGPKRKS